MDRRQTSEPVPDGAYEEMDDMAEFAAGAAHE
jgi:hypothetical protein